MSSPKLPVSMSQFRFAFLRILSKYRAEPYNTCHLSTEYSERSKVKAVSENDKTDEFLEQKLVAAEVLDSAAMSRAKALAKKEQIPLDRATLKLGLLEEDLLLSHLAEALGLPHLANLSEYVLDEKQLATLTAQYCQSKAIAPIRTLEGEALLLVSNPSNHTLAQELAFYLDGPLQLVVAPTRVVRALIAAAANVGEKESEETS